MNQSREFDLLHGPLLSSLIRFALPIAMSSMLQQLFHAMDTSVVGRFADANALAAVGTNGEITAFGQAAATFTSQNAAGGCCGSASAVRQASVRSSQCP